MFLCGAVVPFIFCTLNYIHSLNNIVEDDNVQTPVFSPPQYYPTFVLIRLLLFPGVDLETGALYLIKVRATNNAGLRSEATSDGFTIDFSPPSAGKAWVETGFDIPTQADSSQLNVRYLMMFLFLL